MPEESSLRRGSDSKEEQSTDYYIPDLPDPLVNSPEFKDRPDPELIEKSEGIFIGIWKNRSRKDPNYLLPSTHQSIKLHISLSNEDYVKHSDKISKLLIEYIKKESIHQFKRVDEKVLAKILERLLQAKQQLQEYKQDLSADKKWGDNYSDLLEFYRSINKNGYVCLPENEDELVSIEKSLNRRIKDAERFYNGDQFTIYIPQNVDNDKIAELCAALNNLLTKENINAGEKSDVALPITQHINARMEYFPDDPDHRINAIPDENEPETRREGARTLLRNNPLFKQLTTPPNQSRLNLSCSILMKFLAYPATLPLFLIIIGAIGIVLGSMNLLEVLTDLSKPVSEIITGTAGGFFLGGGLLGLYRFFTSPKENNGNCAAPVPPLL